jgi:ABC-type uncharacterized transport system permease subunit
MRPRGSDCARTFGGSRHVSPFSSVRFGGSRRLLEYAGLFVAERDVAGRWWFAVAAAALGDWTECGISRITHLSFTTALHSGKHIHAFRARRSLLFSPPTESVQTRPDSHGCR